MKILIPIIVLCLSACTSIQLVNRAPEPVPYKNLALGLSRDDVKLLLRQRPLDADPAYSSSLIKTEDDKNANISFDYYQFVDGYDKTLKSSRKFLYIIADIFTLGIGELILTPMEKNVPQGQKCQAKIGFDAKNKLVYYLVKKDNEEVLRELGVLSLEKSPEVNKVDPIYTPKPPVVVSPISATSVPVTPIPYAKPRPHHKPVIQKIEPIVPKPIIIPNKPEHPIELGKPMVSGVEPL